MDDHRFQQLANRIAFSGFHGFAEKRLFREFGKMSLQQDLFVQQAGIRLGLFQYTFQGNQFHDTARTITFTFVDAEPLTGVQVPEIHRGRTNQTLLLLVVQIGHDVTFQGGVNRTFVRNIHHDERFGQLVLPIPDKLNIARALSGHTFNYLDVRFDHQRRGGRRNCDGNEYEPDGNPGVKKIHGRFLIRSGEFTFVKWFKP